MFGQGTKATFPRGPSAAKLRCCLLCVCCCCGVERVLSCNLYPIMLARAPLLLRWYRPCQFGAQMTAVISGRQHGCSNTRRRKREYAYIGAINGLFSSSSAASPGKVEGDVDVDAGPSLREYMATLGVFFTLPDQGVTTPEILTRLVR